MYSFINYLINVVLVNKNLRFSSGVFGYLFDISVIINYIYSSSDAISYSLSFKKYLKFSSYKISIYQLSLKSFINL